VNDVSDTPIMDNSGLLESKDNDLGITFKDKVVESKGES
jgi:hypothetical protein